MSNHTIAAPITSWAELRTTDREVLNRAEVAALLEVDAPRTARSRPCGSTAVLFAHTGLRSGEFLALRRGNVDVTKQEMRIERQGPAASRSWRPVWGTPLAPAS